MKKIFLLVATITVCACSRKAAKTTTVNTPQNVSQNGIANAKFPYNFVGNWSGDLELYSGKGKFNTVPMRLIIQPLKDSVGQFSWQIIYGNKGQDNRPYRLIPVDTAKGKWIIDENDGIKLNAYVLGGTLFSQFAVQGAMLTSIERVEGDKMYYEILSGKEEPVAVTGGSSDSIPPVKSFGITATQKAVLKRDK